MPGSSEKTSGPMRSLRRAARRVADLFPWRPLALLLGALAYVSLAVLAYERLDIVFLVLGYGVVGLLAMATTFTLAAAVLVKVRLRRTRGDARELQMETERPQPSGFVLPAYAWLPLVRVRWEVERTGEDFQHDADLRVVVTRALGTARESLVAHDRGELGPLRRRVVVEDVFGLCRMAMRHDDPLRLEVLPHTGALGRLPVLTTFAGGDEWPHPMGVAEGDRVELRRYAPGDPARFIHWKVFSRTRKLMVRMPERALTRARRTIAYQVAGGADDASAAAARVALARQAFGDDWTFAADGTGATSSAAEASSAIVRSAGYREQGAAQLQGFVREAEKQGPAAVVIFAPPEPGIWLDRVVAVLRARPGRCRVVIAVDGLARESQRRWSRVFADPAPLSGTSLQRLDEVLGALGKERAEVLVIDRRTGTVLSEAHRAAVRGASRPRAGATSKSSAVAA